MRRLSWWGLLGLLGVMVGAVAQVAPRITAFDHQMNGWVTQETPVRFTLRGTPGGKAEVSLAGLPVKLEMRERARGQYDAVYTPTEGITSPRTPAVASLTVNGQTVEATARQPLAIDTVPPTVTEQSPADGATVAEVRPAISAVVADLGGSGIDPQTLQVFIGEQDLTARVALAEGKVQVTPPADLAPGRHEVRLEVADLAGNTRAVTWAVQVAAPAAPAATGDLVVEADPWVRAGQSVRVNAVGPAGAEATFSLVGVQEDIPMRQARGTRYFGSWKAPEDQAIEAANAVLLVKFKVRNTVTTVQYDKPIAIDTVAPKVEAWYPAAGGTVNDLRPWAQAYVSDGEGSGVAADTVQWLIDDKPVEPDQIAVEEGRFTWRPQQPLAKGAHFARLLVRDLAGNEAAAAWAFTLTDEASPIRQAFHDGRGPLKVGDVVHFVAETNQPGKVQADIGGSIKVPLQAAAGETTYRGEWVVKETDRLDGAAVTVQLTEANGRRTEVPANAPLTTVLKPEAQAAPQPQPQPEAAPPAAPALTKPQITAPTEGATVEPPITLTGLARAGAQVKLKLTYSRRVVIAEVTGMVLEQTVTADAQGQWRLENVKLDTALTGRGTRFQLTAWMVNADGTLSEPVVVNFNR